jgi:hypothetical protein
MAKVLSLFIAAIVLCSCGPPERRSSTEPTTPAPSGTPKTTSSNTGTGIGIGDVESQMRVSVTLSDTNESPKLKSDVLQAKNETIANVTVTATKPYPKELFLFVNTRSMANFPGDAVKAVVSIFVEDKKVDEFKFVYGRNGREERNNYTFDLIKHLDEIPTSLLVRAEAHLVYYQGTEEEDITVDSPDAEATAVTKAYSNPLRVNFF